MKNNSGQDREHRLPGGMENGGIDRQRGIISDEDTFAINSNKVGPSQPQQQQQQEATNTEPAHDPNNLLQQEQQQQHQPRHPSFHDPGNWNNAGSSSCGQPPVPPFAAATTEGVGPMAMMNMMGPNHPLPHQYHHPFPPQVYPQHASGGAQAFAAGAAWAAAQIAQAAADYANGSGAVAALGTHPFVSPQPFLLSPGGSFSAPPTVGGGIGLGRGPEESPPHFPPNYFYQGPVPPATTAHGFWGGDGIRRRPFDGDYQAYQEEYCEEAPADWNRNQDIPSHIYGPMAGWYHHHPGRDEYLRFHDDGGNIRHLQVQQQHRRKRQQRGPPAQPIGRFGVPDEQPHTQQQQYQAREKIRRRLRSDGESSSSGSSLHPTYGSDGNTNCHYYNSSYMTSRSNRHHNKKKKQRSDESLLGKTAVSALYEWCSKRQRTPIFVEMSGTENDIDDNDADSSMPHEFDFSVILNDEEDVHLGRGQGRTKSSAKQWAARRALEHLVPGVVFDDATGILLELPTFLQPTRSRHQETFFRQPQQGPPFLLRKPSAIQRTASETAADDLAPNLAKQLAIGREEDTGNLKNNDNLGDETRDSPAIDNDEARKKRGPSLSKRTLDVAHNSSGRAYDHSTTTSGEEQDSDAATYSKSPTGIYIWTCLLHALQAVDPRLPEAPQYSFRVANETLVPNLRRRVAESEAAIRVHREPCSCVVRLKLLLVNEEQRGQECGQQNSTPATDDAQFLEAVGVGPTKRDAKHMASGNMLALLFPECGTMSQIKAAVESVQEMYSVGKSSSKSKRQRRAGSKDEHTNTTRRLPSPRPFDLPVLETDLSLPAHIIKDIKSIYFTGAPAIEVFGSSEIADMSARQSNRQKQIEAQVECALHLYNEQDEEGRLLSDGRDLSENDVGRTVLRKAENDDLERIKKLFSAKRCSVASRTKSNSTVPVFSGENGDKDAGTGLSSAAVFELSSSFPSLCDRSIVLLLCRAIAPYDDPPLGCAMLNMGFSMESGRLLTVTSMAHEPHLPHERFLECIERFSKHMKCNLVSAELAAAVSDTVPREELRSLLKSQITGVHNDSGDALSSASSSSRRSAELHGGRSRVLTPLLQSVKEEESEVSDTSVCADNRAPSRATVNPSKRTRVE